MPLHDWRDDRGWSSLHLVWQNQLLDWVQVRLPLGYRAYLGSVPALAIGTPESRPDLGVRRWMPEASPPSSISSRGAFASEPDTEAVAVFDLDSQQALHVDFQGQIVAAIELVSPRNKDRTEARDRYLSRYLGYLRLGVHLLLVDLLPRPAEFSFADAIHRNLQYPQPACPAPFAASYRVGEPVPEGTLLALWLRPLKIGEVLPTIPLALSVQSSIPIDLEQTYAQAARRAYLT